MHSQSESSSPARARGNPFDLTDAVAYQAWKQVKIQAGSAIEPCIVTLENACELQPGEIETITQLCTQRNMAIYQLQDAAQNDKSLVHALGSQFGLLRLDTNLRADEDSVTSLQVRPQSGNQYIPYTSKALSWHTDGYYNAPDRQIRAIIMHCVSPAAAGGENALLDPEMMYIRLRDENPAWIAALMHPAAMTIPANIEAGTELRGACSGPVFSIDPDSGRLHMRYSARKRNIEWRDDKDTLEAVARIAELLDDESMVLRHALQAGQGVICNNVLHNRTAFDETGNQQRLMYRARYYDRIHNTGLGGLTSYVE